MAPNLITLTGLVFVLINVSCIIYIFPDLVGPTSPWVYYSFAFGLFLYQTFDNVDGRQARRTKTSSALGHIFDHTIDSLNCPLGGLVQVASVGLGHTPLGFFIVMVGCWPMWFSTWEEYHTGTLYLGYINGPDEGLLIAMAVHLISAYFSPAIWHENARSILHLSIIPADATLTDVYLACVFFALTVIHVPACLYNVRKSTRQNGKPFLATLTQHTPFFVYNLIAAAWVLSPHSTLLIPGHNHLGLIEFALVITGTFGRLGPRIILAHLTKSPFPWWNWGSFGPLIGGALLVNALPVLGLETTRLEAWYLHAAVGVSLFSFVQWAVALCLGFCEALDINCLTIKKRG